MFYIFGCFLLIIPLFEFVDRKFIVNVDINDTSFKFTFSLLKLDKTVFKTENATIRLIGFVISIPLFILLMVLDFLTKLWVLLFGASNNEQINQNNNNNNNN